MKTKKERMLMKSILSLFVQNEVLTAEKIADSIGLSEKTVRTKINHINVFLEENNLGSLIKKPRIGIKLKATEQQRIAIKNLSDSIIVEEKRVEQKKRVEQTINFFLLEPNKYYSTSFFSSKLYLSIPTTLKVLKEAEVYFSKYDISFRKQRNKGTRIEFQEIKYRIAFKNYILDSFSEKHIEDKLLLLFPAIGVEKIAQMIKETCTEWGVNLSEYSFSEVLILCVLAVKRRYASQKIVIDETDKKLIEKYNEFSFSQSIFKRMNNYFNLSFQNEETLFIATQLLCSFTLGDESNVLQYDEKLEKFTKECIELIGNILNVNLSQDEILLRGLLLHLRPVLFRLKYRRNTENSLLPTIKHEYQTVFMAVWAISPLFQKYYGFQITEHELTYISLYIQAAVERNQTPLKLLLVSHLPRSHNQLIINRIELNFPSLGKPEVISRHRLTDEYIKNFDIIFVTQLLDRFIDKVILIDNLMTEYENKEISNFIIERTRLTFNSLPHFDIKCHSLFDPEMIFIDQTFKNKLELINFLSEQLKKKNIVTKQYNNTVISREKATSTAVGNGVAIPHGDQEEVLNSRIAIVTLQNPIKWDDDELVDIVILMCLKMNSEEEIEKSKLFYKQYIYLVEEERVEMLRSFKKKTELYKFLIR
ncbi:BglG family transcription antiterminator [Amphibacillus sp. Q70]|uniref:BglG family transcription antiterminator n=1 Tax=Amphibacillus sp. Q70 TaxID=3453416 RepID=UPI003F83AE5D